MAMGGGLGVLEVPFEVMNARPYLILRMTRRVNAFKTNLTCWLVRKYLIRNTLVAGLTYKSATEDCWRVTDIAIQTWRLLQPRC